MYIKVKFISILSILLNSFFGSIFINTNKDVQLSRFETSNYEVINLETGTILKYLFKKNTCETDGYAFLSPFYEDKTLYSSKVEATVKGNQIKVVLKGENKSFDFLLSDFKVSEDKNVVEFTITKDNYLFPSKIHGVNLTEKYVLNMFQKLTDVSIAKENYPACAIITTVYTAYQSMESNKNVQNACFPYTGVLTVNKCSCDCSPKIE